MKRHRPSLLESYAAIGLPINAALYSLGLGIFVALLSLAWAYWGWQS